MAAGCVRYRQRSPKGEAATGEAASGRPLADGRRAYSAKQNPPPTDRRRANTAALIATLDLSLFLRGGELLLQFVEADRSDHKLIADDIARRAVDADRVGELHVFVDGGLHFGAVHVFLEPRHVEADFLGDGECPRQIGYAAAPKKLLVEFDIFRAGRVLHACG